MLETVTFVEQDCKTKMTNRSVFHAAEDRDGALQSGMEKGTSETMDILDKLLKEIQREN
jgi:uncharacterized protein YndB with AHSA1/START domain